MKNITALAIVAATVIGCSYVGSVWAADGDYTASTTCSHVWEISEQANSAAFIEVSKSRPDVTEDVKQTSINVCDSAKRVAILGGSLNGVLNAVSQKTKYLPEEGQRQIAFMAVSGWKIGKAGR